MIKYPFVRNVDFKQLSMPYKNKLNTFTKKDILNII